MTKESMFQKDLHSILSKSKLINRVSLNDFSACYCLSNIIITRSHLLLHMLEMQKTGMRWVSKYLTKICLFPPPEKVSPSTLPYPKFSSPCQWLISPTKQQFPCYNPTKSFIFSWRHCSCIIFILNSYSLNTQVMLSLILIDI